MPCSCPLSSNGLAILQCKQLCHQLPQWDYLRTLVGWSDHSCDSNLLIDAFHHSGGLDSHSASSHYHSCDRPLCTPGISAATNGLLDQCNQYSLVFFSTAPMPLLVTTLDTSISLCRNLIPYLGSISLDVPPCQNSTLLLCRSLSYSQLLHCWLSWLCHRHSISFFKPAVNCNAD